MVDDDASAMGDVDRDRRSNDANASTPLNAARVALPGSQCAPSGAAIHMTERQLYAFRQQVAAYAHICQQLLQITAVQATQQTARQREGTNANVGNGENDKEKATGSANGLSVNKEHVAAYAAYAALAGRGGDKQQRGPRWTGTAKQYELLEDMFIGGQQPPVREKLTEITEMLTQYGPINESNVYNWFQNRRSREKKKYYDAELARVMGR